MSAAFDLGEVADPAKQSISDPGSPARTSGDFMSAGVFDRCAEESG